MHSARLLFFISFFCLVIPDYFSQPTVSDALIPDPAREKMFFPYLAVRHGGPEGTLKWKESHTIQYYQELWYYCKSFSVQKNYFPEGGELQESIIDISRFESQRKQNEIAIVVLPGLKDVLVLLPGRELIYKPEYVQQ